MPEIDSEIIVFALRQFEAGPVWWIGIYRNAIGEQVIPLDECDTNSDFADQFDETHCIETHAPHEVDHALARSREIAQQRQLGLYRVTCFTEDGGDCEVFESV